MPSKSINEYSEVLAMLIKIDQNFHKHLTETEHTVITFLNAHVEDIMRMSITDVAEATYSSPATVSRTIKKCGFSGFAELRYRVARETESAGHDSLAVNEIFNKSLLEVTRTIDHLSQEIVLSVVKELRTAPRIYLLSRGLSEHVAEEFALKLQLLGCNVFANSDAATMQEITSNAKPHELVVIFTLSGKTPELVSAAENALSRGGRLITITCGPPDSPLAQLAHRTVFGYRHQHVSIRSVDAASRLPLYVISRILIDYLSQELQEEHDKAARKQAAQRSKHYFQVES